MYRIEHISRPKLTDFGRHHGIRLPDGRVIHKTNDRIEMVGYQAFALGREVRIEDTVTGEQDIRQTLERLRTEYALQVPYDLITSNCETFARGVIGQSKLSWQVIIAGALTTWLVVALASNNGKRA